MHANILESFNLTTKQDFMDSSVYWVTQNNSRFQYAIEKDINIIPLPFGQSTYTVTREPGI